jgi:hypothetical protein
MEKSPSTQQYPSGVNTEGCHESGEKEVLTGAKVRKSREPGKK